ncbi:MAG: DUF2268 domain-containing putative Zn-dependent protease [Dehalococcoidia bacterium]
MVVHRVSRRTAIVAAAGWVAAPGWAEADGWRCEAPGDAVEPRETAPVVAGRDRVFVLYRELARFLRDPDPDRAAALRRALGSRQAQRARVTYGDGLEEYLLEQTAGLDPEDARWATLADAAAAPAQVRAGLARGRALLDADESPAVFLIFSRRFDGRTDGRRIFFGVDRFGVERLRDQVALLTVHEYNHVVRARATSFATLIGGVVAEGLATACSELAEPDRPLRDHLLFSPAQFGWYTPERLAQLWTDLSAAPFSTDPERRRAYLDGGQPGPCAAPPRSGYYLGYLLIRRLLARGASIATLTRTPAAEIWSWSGDAD